MTSVATLTLNPAVDLTTRTDRVRPTQKLRCRPPRFDPGGGGINVARVVSELGGDVTAVFPVGGPHGNQLCRLLERPGLRTLGIGVAADTRLNVTVHDESSGDEYRFVMPGPVLDPDELDRCLDALGALHPSILVLSGSLPPGLDDATVLSRLCRLARSLDARLVVDSSRQALASVRGAYLVKPSVRELSEVAGKPLPTRADQVAAARGLIEQDRTQNVLVSLGEAGALLVEPEGDRFLPPIAIEREESAVGAGDAMVGAVVVGLTRGWKLDQAAAYGSAAGAATVMTPGTELCRRDDVERLFARYWPLAAEPEPVQ